MVFIFCGLVFQCNSFYHILKQKYNEIIILFQTQRKKKDEVLIKIFFFLTYLSSFSCLKKQKSIVTILDIPNILQNTMDSDFSDGISCIYSIETQEVSSDRQHDYIAKIFIHL